MEQELGMESWKDTLLYCRNTWAEPPPKNTTSEFSSNFFFAGGVNGINLRICFDDSSCRLLSALSDIHASGVKIYIGALRRDWWQNLHFLQRYFIYLYCGA